MYSISPVLVSAHLRLRAKNGPRPWYRHPVGLELANQNVQGGRRENGAGRHRTPSATRCSPE